jgi:hypothetical protein
MGILYYSSDFGHVFYSRRATILRYHDEPQATDCGRSDIKQEAEKKKQRAKVQSKRHKARTFHSQADKDVPSILKNFVNKSAEVQSQAKPEPVSFFR